MLLSFSAAEAETEVVTVAMVEESSPLEVREAKVGAVRVGVQAAVKMEVVVAAAQMGGEMEEEDSEVAVAAAAAKVEEMAAVATAAAMVKEAGTVATVAK
mmetsp:Transcript_51109/g.111035  ORF Transcript_51109/g.111035 Transcript_51109/m.111035 type:complete len:100 (-) Transcript_51109:141-440(-)